MCKRRAVFTVLFLYIGGVFIAESKMKTSMAGLNFSYSFGEEVEVSDDVAKAWVEADIAELVEEEKNHLKKG
jgi:hypothetical protein